jgi:hypothetical protein
MWGFVSRAKTAQRLKATLGLVKIGAAVVLEATGRSGPYLREGLSKRGETSFWAPGVSLRPSALKDSCRPLRPRLVYDRDRDSG